MAGIITTIAQWGMFLGGGHSDDEGNNGGNFIVTLLIMILAPIAAALIQMAVSRSREYMADEGGGELSGDPDALADALLKNLTLMHSAAPCRAQPKLRRTCL